MKRFLFICLSVCLFTCATQSAQENQPQFVQIIDKEGNSQGFPKEFVDQNMTFNLLSEDFPGESIYRLPDSISLEQFKKYYDTAQALDKNALAPTTKPSLQELVQYASYAEYLENEELRQKILVLINAKLKNLPKNHPDVLAAQKLFSQYFKSSPDLKKDVIEIGQIKTTESKKFLEQFLEQYKKNNWIQRLLKQDPNAKIIFALPFSDDSTLPEDIEEVEYTMIQDPDARLMWDSKKTQRHVTRNFNALDDKWQVNKKGFFSFKSFDWDKVYSMAYNNNHTRLAFAIPGKIAITPTPLQSQPKSIIINLKSIHSKAVCSHIAFSCDGNKLTCIIQNKLYVIDLAKNKIIPVYQPDNMDILSSILISDEIALIRSTNDNTYRYNVRTKELQNIPDSKIDYYIVCHPLKDKVLALGLSKNKDGIIHMIGEYMKPTKD